MRIFRVFNNNIVATITDDRKEAIAQGSGIGFQKKAGDLLDEHKIEKLFIFQEEERAQFDRLMHNIPIEYFQLAQMIFSKAEQELHVELSNQAIISLTDHIGFAVARYQEGIILPNLLLDEIRSLYSREYKVGTWGLSLIRDKLHIELPKDEAGYISLHIINAQLSVENDDMINILMFSKGVLEIIQRYFDINEEKDTLSYSRLMMHLRFLAQRIFIKGTKDIEENDVMYNYLIHRNPIMKSCIEDIQAHIKQSFDSELSKPEQMYLMIHLTKAKCK